jgi:hypothetical protein
MLKLMFICMYLFLASTGFTQATIIAAGVPKHLGEGQNFEQIFSELTESGINVFFPQSQYQEVPEAKSLGLESLFLPPCQPLNPALNAMQNENISMIVPAVLLYPPSPAPLPSLDADPIKALYDCLGKEAIFAVYSYDEPVAQGESLESVRRLYQRVKMIDPDLPVMMIHKPLLADDPLLQTSHQIADYLENVKRYSQYADSVGFDVYPLPQPMGQIISPYSSNPSTDYRVLIADYLQWLKTELPDKQPVIVLQGFSFTHLFEEKYLDENVPADMLATIRAPTKEELSEMVKVGLEYHAQIAWWGQSFLTEQDDQLWQDILSVSRDVR